MIAVLIFYIHVVAIVAIFTIRWQQSGTLDGVLSAGFMLLIFGVGWSVSTVILKFFFDAKGLGTWFDRDTMSLVLLTLIEGFFYYAYAKSERQKIV